MLYPIQFCIANSVTPNQTCECVKKFHNSAVSKACHNQNKEYFPILIKMDMKNGPTDLTKKVSPLM